MYKIIIQCDLHSTSWYFEGKGVVILICKNWWYLKLRRCANYHVKLHDIITSSYKRYFAKFDPLTKVLQRCSKRWPATRWFASTGWLWFMEWCCWHNSLFLSHKRWNYWKYTWYCKSESRFWWMVNDFIWIWKITAIDRV